VLKHNVYYPFDPRAEARGNSTSLYQLSTSLNKLRKFFAFQHSLGKERKVEELFDGSRLYGAVGFQ